MIADLHNIIQAFGEDALTPEGVAQINALLELIGQMDFQMPGDATALSERLMVPPALQHVVMGLAAVRTGGAAIAASAAVSAPKVFGDLPIIEFMEMTTTLSSVLEMTFGKPALLPCNDCLFPINEIASSVAQVPVPDVPTHLMR